MNWEKLKKEKEELDKKTKDLNLKKRMLQEQERKLQTKRSIQLGELFSRAGIDTQNEKNDPTLLGALLEIKELLKSPETAERFKNLGKDFEKALDLRYAISFSTSPPPEIKKRLEELNFKYRSTLQEWHGRTTFQKLSETLNETEAKIMAVK